MGTIDTVSMRQGVILLPFLL